MNNLEHYNKVLMEMFSIDEPQLKGLTYQSIPIWDSVGHMAMIATLEEAFDIMMEADDIIDFSSYEKGLEILKSKYGVEF
jgi:acyl carrier protein